MTQVMTQVLSAASKVASDVDQAVSRRTIEFPALTGLRGLLALWVVLFHLVCGLEYKGVDLFRFLPGLAVDLFHRGALAVELFFILSGFIMVHVHAQDFTGVRTLAHFGSASVRFWWLRFIRLWPVHAFILLAYAGLTTAGFQWAVEACGNPETHGAACDRFDVADLPNQLLMIAGWGWAEVYRWNFVSWSISAEWLAYVAFPVLVLLTTRVTAAVAAPLAVVVLAVGVPYQLWLGPTFHGMSDSYSAFRVIPGFLAGCLLGQLAAFDANAVYRSAKPLLALLAACALLSLAVLEEHAKWAVIPGAVLILALAMKVPAGIGTILSSRPLVALGHTSYSLYVSHFLVLEVLGRLTAKNKSIVGSAPRLILSLVVTLIVCVLVGWILHRLIEDPARKRFRGLVSRT